MSKEIASSVSEHLWEPTELTPVMEEVQVDEGFKPKTFRDFSKNKGPFDNVEIIGMSTTGFVAGKMPDGK